MACLYKCFISYSHAADEKLAPAVQSALRRLGKPWYRLRMMQVFRDRTSLSANPALWPAIEKALHDSEYFILMASPEAAQSKWITREVRWWIANRSPDTLLIALTEGHLAWDTAANDFDWNATNALPSALTSFFKDEPLYVDLRWAKTTQNLSLRHTRFRGAMLDLAATLLGLPKDELDGEDVRQFRKTRLLTSVVVAVVLCLGALAGWQAYVAIQQRKVAEEQTNRAVAQKLGIQAQMVFRESDALLERSALLAVESMSRVPLLETDITLRRILSLLPRPVSTISVEGVAESLTFHQNGRHLAAVVGTRVQVFDVATRKLIRNVTSADNVVAMQLSPNGALFATASENAVVRIYNVFTGAEEIRAVREVKVQNISFSPDGQYVALKYADGSVEIIDTTTGRLENRLDKKYGIQALAFSPNGMYIAVSSQHQGLCLLRTRTDIPTWCVDRRASLQDMAFAPDGRYFAATGEDPTTDTLEQYITRIFDVSDGSQVSSFRHWLPAVSIMFHPDGKHLAVVPVLELGLRGSAVHIIETLTGREVTKLTGSIAVDFSPDGKFILTGSGPIMVLGEPDTAHLFEVGSGREVARLNTFQGGVADVTFSPNGNYLATSDQNGMIHVYAVPEDEDIDIPISGEDYISVVRFSPDGQVFATYGHNNGIQVFELDPVGRETRLTATLRPISSVNDAIMLPRDFALTWNTDAKHVAVGALIPSEAYNLKVFDITTERLEQQLKLQGELGAIDLSEDGRIMAAASGGNTVHVFANGQAYKTLHPPALLDIRSVKLTPNGDYLAIGTGKKEIRIFSVETSKEIARVNTNEDVGAIAISADAEKVVMASGTTLGGWSNIRMFESATGAELFRATTPGAVYDMVIAPDESELKAIVYGETLKIKSYALDRGKVVAETCARLTRNLTRAEWARYLGNMPYRPICPNLPDNTISQSHLDVEASLSESHQ